MTEGISIQLEPGFDPRPQWFKNLEQAIEDGKADGWNLARQVVFEGDPYIDWKGEPAVATWSICPCGSLSDHAGHLGLDECPYERKP
jgi:hypothetical protein